MSKSVGNVVDPFNLANQYGVDQMRLLLPARGAVRAGRSYNHEAIVARINADLANDLGNLAQRSLSMIAKQYEGVLPEPGAFSDTDKAILAQADGMITLARTAMATQQIHHWLNAVWAVVAEANRYFAGRHRGHWRRQIRSAANRVVRDRRSGPPGRHSGATGDARLLARLLDILGIPADQRDFAGLGGAARIKPGTALPAPTGIFPRYIEPTAA